MSEVGETSERHRKIIACRDDLVVVLGGPNLAALRIVLHSLDRLQLARDEVAAILAYLRLHAFDSGDPKPRNHELVDELYGWVYALNLKHDWDLEVAEHRLSMHTWKLRGARSSPLCKTCNDA